MPTRPGGGEGGTSLEWAIAGRLACSRSPEKRKTKKPFLQASVGRKGCLFHLVVRERIEKFKILVFQGSQKWIQLKGKQISAGLK